MCDTLVALGNSTKNGRVIFAKNSDRQPNEPQIIVRIPRKKYSNKEKLKCTYIEIEQVEETYEVLLVKPSWIWGCEMGSNEFALTIGNEAVFTKEKYGSKGLTGMDMVRIALERCKTSEEALKTIIDLLGKYGQGGNCGYEKPFYYHNSFLIADKDSAWVLETSGAYWVAQKVKNVRSISNCLTIGSEFDIHHPDVINHAIEKGWCRSKEDFNFARCYSDPLVTRLSESKRRHSTTDSFLRENLGLITTSSMMNILRHHNEDIFNKEFEKHSISSVCMHGGFIYGDQSTGSFIAELNEPINTYWVTGSSAPCISLYKPLWMIKEENITFRENEIGKAIEFWLKREKLHRMIIENRISDLSAYIDQRNTIEDEIINKVNDLDLRNIDELELNHIMSDIFSKDSNLVENTINKNSTNRSNIRGNVYYKYFWKKKSKKLGV